MDPELTNKLIALEKRLHEPEIRKSPQEVGRLLADSFVEIGSSGRFYTRSDIIDELASEEGYRVDAADFAATQLSPAVFSVTYKTRNTVRESIWLDTEDGWKMVFHRGTRVS